MTDNSQDNNKDNEIKSEALKKSSNNQASKRHCKTCKMEIEPAFLCGCSGGGGSGGAGGDEGKDSDEKLTVNHTQVVKSMLTPDDKKQGNLNNFLTEKTITIDNNVGLCTLSIKADAAHLQLILQALKDFKGQHGMTDRDCQVKEEKDKSGNLISLSINIPNAKLYNKFIQFLQENKLLPVPVTQQGEGKANNLANNQFNPTPFSKKLTP